jgi:serine/threonine protein kinase
MMHSFAEDGREEEDWSSASASASDEYSRSLEDDEESSTLYSGDSRDEEHSLERPIHRGLSGLVRRVGHGIATIQSFPQEGLEDVVNSSPDKKKTQVPKGSTGRSIIAHYWTEMIHDKCPAIGSQTTCRRASSVVLVMALIIWLNVMAFYHPSVVQLNDGLSVRDQSYALSVRERNTIDGHIQPPPGHSKEHLDRIRNKNKSSALGGQFLEAASDGFWNAVTGKKRGAEEFSPGCVPAIWHTQSFPNCNDVHEIDLRFMLPTSGRSGRRRSHGYVNGGNETSYIERPKYISSGMWRDVWSVTPRWIPSVPNKERAVLKMIKPEHDVNSRNLDRHRRDAMVMERLTSSPNVVSIYGHCANTVLTEMGAQTLESVLFSGSRSGSGTHHAVSRSTPLGRLRLARDAAKGLAALHGVDGGPVIHADITPKQFLVDFEGTIKLNDFNRCRLLPHKNVTNEKCRIRIPSAPGLDRSPEEYQRQEVDEKLDVYSLGNVFYSILTGTKPWRDEGSNTVKKWVRDGKKPLIDEAFRKEGTSDGALAVLINLAYELDPAARISATALVHELDLLIENEKGQPLTLHSTNNKKH